MAGGTTTMEEKYRMVLSSYTKNLQLMADTASPVISQKSDCLHGNSLTSLCQVLIVNSQK